MALVRARLWLYSMHMRFFIVDVFAEQKYAGNPLAVFVTDERSQPQEWAAHRSCAWKRRRATAASSFESAGACFRLRKGSGPNSGQKMKGLDCEAFPKIKSVRARPVHSRVEMHVAAMIHFRFGL